MSDQQTLRISDIQTGGGTQPRSHVAPAVVDQYAELMRQGRVFPPISVYHDGAAYWLVDGFHRVEAAKKASLTELIAEVTNGTLQDAQWASYSANGTHGQPRSRADIARAIKMALLHPNSKGLSDRALADQLNVSHPTIATYRKELPQVADGQPVERVASNGRKFKVAANGTTNERPRTQAGPLVRVRRIWQESTDSERQVIKQWLLAQ
jgi:ParB-like chromosome segregation protein Spo0J